MQFNRILIIKTLPTEQVEIVLFKTSTMIEI